MKKEGFTLIEFIVVLTIIALIATFILVSVKSGRARARDGRRLQEISQIVKALQLYWADYGEYPEETCPCADGGFKEKDSWESSDQEPEQFLEYLTPYLSEIPLDPINSRSDKSKFFGPRPEEYFYAYQKYDPPPDYCPEIERPFVVIAVSNLEAYVGPELPEDNMPLPIGMKTSKATCGDAGPDGICTVNEYKAKKCRDWSQEFDYSIMLIE